MRFRIDYKFCESIISVRSETIEFKDTLASDSGILDIRGYEKKLYHHVRLVKKFLFPCPEIWLRHPLLRNR